MATAFTTGISFSSVVPGAVMIPYAGWNEMEKMSSFAFDAFLPLISLLGKSGPEEVANLATFKNFMYELFVNGASIVFGGGERCGSK
jgi:hypothetical protein